MYPCADAYLISTVECLFASLWRTPAQPWHQQECHDHTGKESTDVIPDAYARDRKAIDKVNGYPE